jgi:hypothetical protein
MNLPHELLAAGYQAPNREQYYPQGLVSTIYHLGSGLVYDCLLSPEHNERSGRDSGKKLSYLLQH